MFFREFCFLYYNTKFIHVRTISHFLLFAKLWKEITYTILCYLPNMTVVCFRETTFIELPHYIHTNHTLTMSHDYCDTSLKSNFKTWRNNRWLHLNITIFMGYIGCSYCTQFSSPGKVSKSSVFYSIDQSIN